MKQLIRFAGIASIALFAAHCANLNPSGEDAIALKSPNLPAQAYDYASRAIVPIIGDNNGGGIFIDPPINIDPLPGGFGTPEIAVTNDGATLGRVLFYDARLSANNVISCGSCHKADKGFGDDTNLTVGFKGMVTKRNSMPIANLGLQKGFFWVNNENPLKTQVLNPVRNHLEMGMEDVSVLVSKLEKVDYYPALFQKAFGSSEITEDKISDAITQFLFSMTSQTSKFDRVSQFGGINGMPAAQLTSIEKAGAELFDSERLKCGSCHHPTSSVFAMGGDDGYGGSIVPPDLGRGTNIGLNMVDTDLGNGGGGFKIPNLRNVAITAPYMHDGRFTSLEQVIEHYNTGVKDNARLDSRLRSASGEPVRLNLSSFEKEALIAFLNTLTDYEFIADPKFSDPFKQ